MHWSLFTVSANTELIFTVFGLRRILFLVVKQDGKISIILMDINGVFVWFVSLARVRIMSLPFLAV